MPDELNGFTECFITGTAAEVTPVSEIAQWRFTPGAISEQSTKDYTAEVQPEGQGSGGVVHPHRRSRFLRHARAKARSASSRQASRASTFLRRRAEKDVDGRVKPRP